MATDESPRDWWPRDETDPPGPSEAVADALARGADKRRRRAADEETGR